jgi:acyl-CoA synthetase (AMP-forming)/AMP-acid ligase II/pimeloyl-ACP methyl ester carboxylesterase
VVAARITSPASRPPTGLPGLDPAWSRLIEAPDSGAPGTSRTWHVLDSDADAPASTPVLLCVHGNPTWSYLWRRMLAAAPAGWRVVAPDQLGMGYSQRLGAARALPQRVQDLGDLTAAMGITGPVVSLAHDWGGSISLGWALAHRDQLRGVVLTNTAVHQPADSRPPVLIRGAHLPGVRQSVCVRTPAFVRAATALSRPALPSAVRDAFAAPYRGAARRSAVADFVADIPFAPGHRSHPALSAISDGVRSLDVPALLLWGPRDPVFGEQYLRDLRARLPHARVHRYEGASHLLPEDAPQYANDVATWLADLEQGDPDAPEPMAIAATPAPPVWQSLLDRAASSPDGIAASEVGGASITWAQLDSRVRATASGLVAAGVRPGHRVAMLVPPSIELTVAVYAVWRAGATIVVADKGLGVRGMGRALRSANVNHVIGAGQGLAAAALMRLPGTRLLAGPPTASLRRALRADAALAELAGAAATERAAEQLPTAAPEDEAAVVFTSGATGPAKGVLYRHRQLQAQISAVRTAYELTERDRIVAAFAPFALYGPALGVASAVPAIDVTKPGTLTAAALSDAVRAIDATVIFASPAALRNVVATAGEMTVLQRGALRRVRLLMSAGAPVPLALLQSLRILLPSAESHTPYGMTEVLPVTDVSMGQIEQAGDGDGVCVGSPLPGVDVMVSPLDSLGTADGPLTADPGVSGEICVRAQHTKDRYDTLWATERAASRNPGWHRTGDVGYLDESGRLWIQGRLPHLITTAGGVLTPVGIEQVVEGIAGVKAAAAVGVGPTGTQQLVVVIESSTPGRRRRRSPVADLALIDAVHAAVAAPVSAVLLIATLPVDIRHASKIDRAAVSRWAADVLAGA